MGKDPCMPFQRLLVVGLRWGPIICISDKLLDNADAFSLGPHWGALYQGKQTYYDSAWKEV